MYPRILYSGLYIIEPTKALFELRNTEPYNPTTKIIIEPSEAPGTYKSRYKTYKSPHRTYRSPYKTHKALIESLIKAYSTWRPY